METTVLQRAPILIPDTPAELLAAAVPAENSVRGTLEKIELLTESAKALASRLPALLFAELGITPFTEESVKQYKAAELEKRKTWFNRHPFIAAGVNWVGFLMMIGAMLGLTAGSFLIPTVKPPYAAVSAIGLILTCCLLFFGGHSLAWEANKRDRWVSDTYLRYIRINRVPERIKLLASQFEKLCPGDIDLRVDYLTDQRTIDPFLVAWVNGERYYVAVWDEKDFAPKST